MDRLLLYLTNGNMIENVPVPGQLCEDLYFKLAPIVNKLIKETLQEELTSQYAVVVQLPCCLRGCFGQQQ